MNKSEIRAAASVGLLYVVRMLGLFMVLPVLPLVADSIEAATPLLIGVAIGIYGLSQALLQIPLGVLSDRVGRKQVIIGGLVVFVVGSVVAGLADDVYGIIAGRFLQGCGAIASTLLALVSDVTRIEHRSKAMAIVGISIGASFGIALILGPFVASFGGISSVFLLTAILGVVGIGAVIFLIPTTTLRSRNPQSNLDPSRIFSVLADGSLRRTSVSVFMLHYLLMSSFIVLPVIMRGTGMITDVDHHYIYFWLLLGSFVMMMPFMWLSDRPAFTKPMMLTMILSFVLATALLSTVRGYYPVLVAMLIFFMAFNLLEVILPALVSRLSPAADRGTAMGIYSTSQFAGGFAGGVIGGAMISLWDIPHLMYANAIVCFGWFLYAMSMAPVGNYRTVTWPLASMNSASASDVADALLSVNGVIDVALIEEEGVAYLKVDSDRYDQQAHPDLQPAAIEATSK